MLLAPTVIQNVDPEASGEHGLHKAQLILGEALELFHDLGALPWDPPMKKIFQGPGWQGMGPIEVVAPGQALKNTEALLVTCRDLGADPNIKVHRPWCLNSWWQASYWGPWWVSSWYRACSSLVKQMMCQAESSIRLATWSIPTPWSINSHNNCKSSRLFNTCQYGQQVVVVDVSVKVTQPARCFVSHNCSDRGFEIIAMGLLGLYGIDWALALVIALLNALNPTYGIANICHQIHCMHWGHPNPFHTNISLWSWYKIICMGDMIYRLTWLKLIKMISIYLQSGMHMHFN